MRSDIAARLDYINRQLSGFVDGDGREHGGLYVELGECRKAEAEHFGKAYMESGTESVTASKMVGRQAALPFYLEGLGIGARISAYEAERDHLRFMVEHEAGEG